MKYNLLYLLSLCTLLFASCRNESEMDNDLNPGYEAEDEPREVSFSFSFDAANRDVEYEPLTRGGEDNDWGRIKISNAFNYVILKKSSNNNNNYNVVRVDKGKLDSKSEPDADIYIPGEYDLNFKEYLHPGEYTVVVFTGAERVEFNEGVFVEGYSFNSKNELPYAIRYKKQDVRMKIPNEETLEAVLVNDGANVDGEKNELLFTGKNMLAEPIYYGIGTFKVRKSEYIDDDKTMAVGCTVEFVNRVSMFRPVFGESKYNKEDPESPGAEYNTYWPKEIYEPREPVVFVATYGELDRSIPAGLDILGNSWYSESFGTEGLFCYPMDQTPQEDNDGGEYLTGSAQPGDLYAYMFYSTEEEDAKDLNIYVGSLLYMVPAGSVDLYDMERWESHESALPWLVGVYESTFPMLPKALYERQYGLPHLSHEGQHGAGRYSLYHGLADDDSWQNHPTDYANLSLFPPNYEYRK